jgi:NADPH2:quinone reductase
LYAHGTPRFGVFDEPQPSEGTTVVEVAAAAISRFDIFYAAGNHALKPAALPIVVGTEGVGRLPDGRRVYFAGPVPPFGSMAERSLVQTRSLIEVPEGVDDAVAAALGNSGLAAWLPLTWRARLAPRENVLIVGATGIVGRIAVQAARLLGAARVVAAGRDEVALRQARELGADAVVRLGDSDNWTEAYRTATGGAIDVIVDYVWGPAVEAAISAAAVGARIVQVGRSGSEEIRLSADTMRAKSLSILGYATYHAPFEVRAAAYRRLTELAGQGQLAVDVERVPLSEVERAWERQRAGARSRLVVLP